MKSHKFLIPFIFLIILLSLIGCSAQKNASNPTPITLQLKWIHQAQFAGYYAAKEKGFYTEENIAITILPGGPGIDYFDVLETGQADFAVVRPEGIFIERSEGYKITAIATIYRRNPYLMVSKADSGITTPYDFPGHIIAIGGTGSDIQYLALLNNLGIDHETITTVPFEFDYTPFYAGDVDVMPAFAAGSLMDIQKTGVELNYIWPSDYGVHWYSDTLAASDELLASNPDLVIRFLRATLKGHDYALIHPEEAVDISLKYAQVQDKAVQMGMLEASVPLIHTGEGELGWMDSVVWQSMHDDLLEQGIIPAAMDINQVYTLKFLEDVYR